MPQHKTLSQGDWQKLTLMEQMGNIGGEISRAARAEGRDGQLFWGAVMRALELFDLTLDDPRLRGRRWEIARAREIFCDAVFGNKEYRTSLNDLTRYFDQFAYASRLQK
jgi:hypothetical protein